jgi:hypothetical protein
VLSFVFSAYGGYHGIRSAHQEDVVRANTFRIRLSDIKFLKIYPEFLKIPQKC